MRILIFNGFYYPAKNYGGPQTSIQNLVETCGDQHTFYVVSRNHDFNSKVLFDVPVHQQVRVGKAIVIYVRDCDLNYSYSDMKSFIEDIRPDLIWFAGVLVPSKRVVGSIVARKLHIPVLFSPRGEVNADHVSIKAWKKIPMLVMLRVFGIYRDAFFHSTCKDEYDGVFRFFRPKKDHVFLVPNIPLIKQPVLFSHHKVKGVLRCYFVSRIHPVKNLVYVIKALSLCYSEIVYDVYGPIEDTSYWADCGELISRLPFNVKVTYKGYLSREDLSRVIQSYDCLVFMSLNENYSHTIVESLSNSRPVIIGRGATPWDDIDGKAGFVVSLEDPVQLAKILDEMASMDDAEYKRLVHSTSAYFDESELINTALRGHIEMFNSINELHKCTQNG